MKFTISVLFTEKGNFRFLVVANICNISKVGGLDVETNRDRERP
jgi:hypothetical protein